MTSLYTKAHLYIVLSLTSYFSFFAIAHAASGENFSQYMKRLEAIDQKAAEPQGVFSLLRTRVHELTRDQDRKKRHKKRIKRFLLEAVEAGELACTYILFSYSSQMVGEHFGELATIAEKKGYKDIFSLLDLHGNFYDYLTRAESGKAFREFRAKYRVDQKLPDGSTLFQLALVSRNTELAYLLFKEGASVKIKNRWGQKALHLAMETRNFDLIHLIYDQDVDVLLEKDLYGKTPFFYAQQVECESYEEDWRDAHKIRKFFKRILFLEKK